LLISVKFFWDLLVLKEQFAHVPGPPPPEYWPQAIAMRVPECAATGIHFRSGEGDGGHGGDLLGRFIHFAIGHLDR